jgi:hypothetical protein
VSAAVGVGPSNNVSLMCTPSLGRRGGEFSMTPGGDYWVTADTTQASEQKLRRVGPPLRAKLDGFHFHRCLTQR